MKSRMILMPASVAIVTLISSGGRQQGTPPDLSSLWAARVRFGPDIRGPLVAVRNGTDWQGEIAGFRGPVHVDGNQVSFQLPDAKGAFRGALTRDGIVGHWIGAINQTNGRVFATPVILRADGKDRWRGDVIPLEDHMTLFMPVTRRAGGGYSTYLRNPERNQGRFTPVSAMELRGDVVRLIGRRGNDPVQVLAEGRYLDGSIRIPLFGASFDFTRVERDSSTPFFPRGNPPQRYRYTPPPQLNDGWPVGTLESAGISRAGMEQFVQMLIDKSMDSVSTSQVHSLLIARRGRLVLEEYFHGHHRDLPHATRSASKSWTAVLIGAAMHAGVPIRLDTPVYRTMLGSLTPDLDPRKRIMVLEHLLSMTAGYHCGPADAPGNEGVMQQQTAEPDWLKYTLNVPMTTAPGDTIVYCDAQANLAAGMLQKVSGEPLSETFYRLVARPLQMKNYHLQLAPNGHVYGGGGHYFLPRDFMKLAQLMVNEGRWDGKQILSAEWARQSTSALRNLTRVQQYGWLWNSLEYPYKDRKVRAFFAGGNGGQIFMGIPDLDLVIAFTGGNYGDPALFIPQRIYVPQFILPSVQ